MSPPVLDISAVVKDYRGLRPLRMERLTLGPGDQLAVLGFDEASAEMMTTLVTGASVPDTGTIHVLGTSTAAIANSDDWLRLVDRLGIVTERAVLLDSLSVIQNLAIPFTLAIEPPPDDVRVRAEELATEVGLPLRCWERPVSALDGNHRTRVRLARAISLDPALILMEHPTALVARPDVRTLARDIRSIAARRGLATLTLTADVEFAEGVATRVVTWDPARGTLRERRRGWRPWGR